MTFLNARRTTALLVALLSLVTSAARADEGMWLPLLLKQLNEADMQKKGLKLSAEDIYSINKGSLKDAVVQFGGGCTGEIISDQGLVLTNHHCGYGQIQQHSTVEKDYLTNGYWAMNRQQELPNPGLTVTFIVRMEDVTKQVLAGIAPGTPEALREQQVQANGARVAQAAVQGTHYQSFVRDMFGGNEYYLFITEVFQDIRLVGAPPSSIGKFGGDTDNWAWPRHTGDFSMFRIYAGPDNQPAAYSPNNVPFKPRHHLPISLAGIKPGDFTLVFGFPGRTNQYLTSWGIDEIYSVDDPARVQVRSALLKVWDADMQASDKVRIQYSAKYARIANYWKKWQGEMRGLKKLDAVERKRKQEAEFRQWVAADPARQTAYGAVLNELEINYATERDYVKARAYISEAALGVELLKLASSYHTLLEQLGNKALPAADRQAAIAKLRSGLPGFFRDYNLSTDRKTAAVLLPLYANNTPPALLPGYVTELKTKYKTAADWAGYANELFAKSRLGTEEGANKVADELAAGNLAGLAADPALQLAAAVQTTSRNQIQPVYQTAANNITLLQRTYIAGLRQWQTERKFYPDANSTMRVAYGEVAGYDPADGVHYDYYTTLDGIMEKADPNNPEFVVPAKLVDLYTRKDYGPYGVNGTVPVAFIATNHTTGGNSGSPVINGRGELIGTNFDRAWESTMSDLMFDPDRVRNIAIDVRYMLFVVDKFAGASHLVKEMTLVGAPDMAPTAPASPVKKMKTKRKKRELSEL